MPPFPTPGRKPSARRIEEENQAMLRRQQQFRRAAEVVAHAFAQFPAVERIALFGSVAAPLRMEIPRFRELRRAGVAILHECEDADLAVWVRDVPDLKALQNARSRALNELFDREGIGVAHHQVDVFFLAPGTDRYLGRLCWYGTCPKGKPECRVPGCGASPFLRQHEDFTLPSGTLRGDRMIVLHPAEPAR
jgi:hypothetical protein